MQPGVKGRWDTPCFGQRLNGSQFFPRGPSIGGLSWGGSDLVPEEAMCDFSVASVGFESMTDLLRCQEGGRLAFAVYDSLV